MEKWRKNNTLGKDFGDSFEDAMDEMTRDLYHALCDIYKKWKTSEYDVSDLIDRCIDEACMRANEINL